MASELFKEYYARVAKEGWLKAFFCAGIIGFCAMLVSAAAFWWADVKQFWLSFIVLVVVTGGLAPLFFFKRFKPTTKEIAKRVDALGLEERMLTMNQLMGEESFIAMKQREDAQRSLTTVNSKMLKIAVSVPLVIALSISGVFGLGMTTVSALSALGYLKSGNEYLGGGSSLGPKEFEITYDVEGEGIVEGDIFQLVLEGEDATPVMAVPFDGWAFVEWSDGSTDPYRQDIMVEGAIAVKAIFAEVQDEGGIQMPGGGDIDAAGDQPGGGEGLSDNKGGDGPSSSEGGAGKYEPNNQIIDGNTFYGDTTFDEAYDAAMDQIKNDAEMSQDKKDLVGNYLETIEK